MKKFFADFKAFATKGNVVDMAVGLVVGNAFKDIVNGLVKHIISPLIGLATGGVSFAELSIVLKEAVKDEAGEIVTEALTLNYGAFLQTIIDFLIIAFSIFVVIRVMTNTQKRLASLNKKKLEEEAKAAEEAKKKAEAEAEEAKKKEPAYILGEIRDLLTEMKKETK